MSAIEQRARELLSKAYSDTGAPALVVDEVRRGESDTASDNAAIRAIVAALTPPEGFVLVPVEPTRDMLRAPTRIVCGHRQETIAKMYHSMLAARPEVP